MSSKSTRSTRMPHNVTGLAAYPGAPSLVGNANVQPTNSANFVYDCVAELTMCQNSGDCINCLKTNYPASVSMCSLSVCG